METRKITIVSTKTQKKSVILSGAETLGELKRDLREANIDYDDMAFYEGVSRTELKTDESILPKDVPYTNRTTGETKNTNELVFMLTNTNKKIKSGAGTMTRAEVYSAIKAKGLQDACVKKYGKNFTQCATADLINLINGSGATKTAPAKKEAPKAEPKKAEASIAEAVTLATPAQPVHCVDLDARVAIRVLTNALYNEDYIDNEVRDEALSHLEGEGSAAPMSAEYKPDSASPYTNNEIDAMFKGMC